MTERLKKLCAQLVPCKRFIDVGCDHGYCTAYMLERRLCERAVIADVSAKSLSKAERLLSRYVSYGLCSAVCCDGLEGIAEEEGDLVLIAGMGGDEILKIIKNAYIPQAFVFQPMKNSQGLRKFLIESGCAIDYDGIFTETRGEEVKHYFVLRGRRTGGTPAYSEYELAFGRDSLGTPELARLISDELEKNAAYLSGRLSPASRREVEQRIEFLKGGARKVKPADIFGILEREVAPVALSDELCAKYGAYDNSGIILDCGNEVTGAIFCLDLTGSAVAAARKAGYNLIVTHHPAIFRGIKSVSIQPESPTAALAKCALLGISVISMHLNFDAAPCGIDYYLAEGLGCGIALAFFNPLPDNCGYGRVGLGKVRRFEELRAQTEKVFGSPNFRYYPCNGPVKSIASFCGAGCDDDTVEFAIRHGADVFVSAEIKHHHLVRLRSLGMGVIDMTHYGCEIYGFGRIYGEIKAKLGIPSELFVQRELI